jgi:hypothetical protein
LGRGISIEQVHVLKWDGSTDCERRERKKETREREPASSVFTPIFQIEPPPAKWSEAGGASDRREGGREGGGNDACKGGAGGPLATRGLSALWGQAAREHTPRVH